MNLRDRPTPRIGNRNKGQFQAIPLLDRIESKIERVPFSTCWYWIGAISSRGYGSIYLNGRIRTAHSVTYEIKYGKVPAGKELNHLCKHKSCCNPDCLEAVTHSENMRYSDAEYRAGRKRVKKMYCTNGHPLFGPNYVRSRCRTCSNDYRKKLHSMKKALAAVREE